MEISTLKEKLYCLVNLTVKRFDEYVDLGKIRQREYLYVKRVVLGLRYEDRSLVEGSKFEIRNELEPSGVHKLVEMIKKEQLFRDIAMFIANVCNTNEGQATFWLNQLLIKILNYYYRKELGREKLSYLVDLFVDELMGKTIIWHVEAWLMGINLDVPKIELDEGVVLRRPSKEDFEIMYPIHVLPLYKPIIPSEVPDAVLEINRREKLTPYLYPYKERVIFALQLYKPCSLYEVYARWKPEAIIQVGGERASMQLLSPTFRCTLTKEDERKLQEFIKIIAPKIPINEKRGVLELKSYLGIALTRYHDALLKPEPISNKIAYATFGLEALYLKGEEKEKLSRRLAQRVSKVMYLLNRTSNPKCVYKDVKKAYGIRSAYVHGSHKELLDRDLLDKIVDYLRLSILVFIQVSVEKDWLVELIDEQSSEELKKLLEKNIITLGG